MAETYLTIELNYCVHLGLRSLLRVPSARYHCARAVKQPIASV
eukprot:COSAG01_NODE_16245_length_1255_cov_3.674740_1_plen_42_part_10